jgi:hypothetical protein
MPGVRPVPSQVVTADHADPVALRSLAMTEARVCPRQRRSALITLCCHNIEYITSTIPLTQMIQRLKMHKSSWMGWCNASSHGTQTREAYEPTARQV